MKKLIVLSSVLFLTACGGIEAVHLKHPVTGKIVQCDLLPGYTYSDAAAIQLDCINIYILLHGYRRIEGIRETEARLLKVITQLRQGQPDYEQIEPGLSASIKQQLPMMQAKLQALGSLQALSYRGQKQGADSYLVESVNGFSDWTIALSPIGRISTLWFRPHEHQILYCDKGEIALRAGKHDLAVEHVSRCIKQGNLKGGTLAVAYNIRAVAYRRKGLHDQAITDFNKAIELNPDDPRTYINRGNAYEEKGLYDRAIEDYGKAIALEPDDADAYSHLAWVLATSPDALYRNGKRALELAEKAVKLDRNAHYLAHLSAAYAEVGRFEEAISTQLQGIALLKKEGDKSSMADFQRQLERYRAHRPWRMK